MSPGKKDSAKVYIVETGQVLPNAQETSRYLRADAGMVYSLLKGEPLRGPNKTGLTFQYAYREDKVTDRMPKAYYGKVKLAKFIRDNPGIRIHVDYKYFELTFDDISRLSSMMIDLALAMRKEVRIMKEPTGLVFLWKEGNATQR